MPPEVETSVLVIHRVVVAVGQAIQLESLEFITDATSVFSARNPVQNLRKCWKCRPSPKRLRHRQAVGQWNEAIMLWLSWNSTYEKATEKMYKGASKEKLRAMLSEMEYLRKQAIELSQGLLGCTN